MVWFDTRCTLEDKTIGLLVAKAAEHFQIITNNRVHRYRSQTSIQGVLFEVKSLETERNYIVNLAEQTFTCLIWQSSGYPCGHAISILLQEKEDPQRYVKQFFTIAGYKKTYEQPLLPLDLTNVHRDAVHSPPTISKDNDGDSDSEDSDATDVLPPSTRRPPGRPRKRRIRGQHEERPKRAFKCSRRNATGHLCRTCREAINTKLAA
jgi:hypothetical protein